MLGADGQLPRLISINDFSCWLTACYLSLISKGALDVRKKTHRFNG